MALSILPLEEQALPVLAAIDEACRRIPPLWPLQNFVAVNPFLGLTELAFADAAQILDKVAHAAPFMDAQYYLSEIRKGSIAAPDITAALNQLNSAVHPADPVSWLTTQLAKSERSEQHILTVADSLDRRHSTQWTAFIVDEISKWCSSYFDQGQSSWKLPWQACRFTPPGNRSRKSTPTPKCSDSPVFASTQDSYPNLPMPPSRKRSTYSTSRLMSPAISSTAN